MSSPVHYVTVSIPADEIIGYLWADDTTVDLIHRSASSSDAYEAGGGVVPQGPGRP
ncbi:hypothetical protein GCM10020295_54540 [Streptomyces cinereospinus]